MNMIYGKSDLAH